MKQWLYAFWRRFIYSPDQFSWGRKWMRFYHTRFSPAGKALLLVLVVCGSLGMVGTVVPLYMLSLALLALATGVVCEGWPHRPRQVACFPQPAAPVTAGWPLRWPVRVENQGARILYELGLECLVETPWQTVLTATADLPVWLKPGQVAEVWLEMPPQRRGVYKVVLTQVFSGFPFNLYRWRKALPQSHTLLVFPAYRHLEELDLKFGRKYQPGGILVSSSVGDSVEFMGIRDFLPGDNPRHIHWPSLAKTGQPAVKEFHEEYFVRLGLVIDGETQGSADFAQAFEAAISLTASIADWIARQDYILDVFATGNHLYHFQAGRSLGHLSNVLEILACLEPCREIHMEELLSSMRPYLAQLSAIVCVFLNWDAERERFVHQLLNLGLGIKILIVNRSEGDLSVDPDFLPSLTILRPEDWESVRL